MNAKRLSSARVRFAVIAVALLASTPAFGQAWVRFTSTSVPRARRGHAMATDGVRGQAYLFGGAAAAGPAPSVGNELWTWNGADWSRVRTTTVPSARSGAAMVYDSARARLVLVGGTSPDGLILSETWEFDGIDWTLRTPAHSPFARANLAMAYDSGRGRTVLVNAYGSAAPQLETWEWDGNDWTRRFSFVTPFNRVGFALAFDASRGRTVMFGGIDPAGGLAETWEWDGTDWFLLSPIQSPPARWEAAIAYDATRGRVVLFGGTSNTRLGDTWEWTGDTWLPITTNPSPTRRAGHAMTFDPACGNLLLFGGEGTTLLDDTWSLRSSSTLSGLSRTLGSELGDDFVRVNGAGFTDATDTSITFGGQPATIVDIGCAFAIVRTPPGTGTVDVAFQSRVGASTLQSAFTYVPREIAARFGRVGESRGDAESVISVNGTFGDGARVVTAGRREPLFGDVTSPFGRVGPTRYVVWAWASLPDATTLRALPRGLGDVVLPTPIGGGTPQPVAIFNTLGFRQTLGAPTIPSSPAPTALFRLSRGVNHPIRVTLQGLIEDDGSRRPEHVSVTNAVILRVE